MKKKSLDNFANDQLSLWPLARDNYRALKAAEVRTMSVNGLEVRIQHNPARAVSTAAKVDDASVRQRKCFLCRDNRPDCQISLKFDGRKGKKYDILVNPYPIFPRHFVIAMDRHCDQSIWKRYVDMLDFAKARQGYAVMYNGPKCGASAPDHHHFQAVETGVLPLQCDVGNLFDAMSGATGGPGDSEDGVLEYLSSVKEADLFHYRRFAHGIFALRASTAKSMAKLFYRLLDCAPMKDGDSEPMFNLVVWHTGTEYRSTVMFRDSHRSHHYFSGGPDHLMISPGCADMAGFFIAPQKEDFEKLSPELLSDLVSEVALQEQDEKLLLWRLTRHQPVVSVGIMSAPEICFEILADGAGKRKAVYKEGKIEYDGVLYDELYFEEQTPSTMFAEAGFILHDVSIGKGFHWERKEVQKFAGALKITVGKNSLRAINVIGVEDYLLSVISSEMKSTSSLELLKAHAVISRSWVMKRILGHSSGRKHVPEWVNNMPSLVTHVVSSCGSGNVHGQDCDGRDRVEYVRWYDNEEHKAFDVCADDHCQRYQGLTRAAGDMVRKAIDSTWGELLTYEGGICDARFSKCCGGITERFSTCWEDRDYPYLSPVEDCPGCAGHEALPDCSSEKDAADHIMSGGRDAFCSTSDPKILSQVLNDYDMETPDFYRWTETYAVDELSSIVRERSGYDIGTIREIVPEHRGASGRIDRLRITGSRMTLVVGKELEIRRILSRSHLKSSAFTVRFGPGSRIVISGAGWGHGAGLCQIGAAVMAEEGYGYRQILSHYYREAVISRHVPGLESDKTSYDER